VVRCDRRVYRRIARRKAASGAAPADHRLRRVRVGGGSVPRHAHAGREPRRRGARRRSAAVRHGAGAAGLPRAAGGADQGGGEAHDVSRAAARARRGGAAGAVPGARARPPLRRLASGQRTYLPYLDVTRILAVLGVVAIHVVSGGVADGEVGIAVTALDMALKVAVPIFFMMSGALSLD